MGVVPIPTACGGGSGIGVVPMPTVVGGGRGIGVVPMPRTLCRIDTLPNTTSNASTNAKIVFLMDFPPENIASTKAVWKESLCHQLTQVNMFFYTPPSLLAILAKTAPMSSEFCKMQHSAFGGSLRSVQYTGNSTGVLAGISQRVSQNSKRRVQKNPLCEILFPTTGKRIEVWSAATRRRFLPPRLVVASHQALTSQREKRLERAPALLNLSPCARTSCSIVGGRGNHPKGPLAAGLKPRPSGHF